MVWLKPAIPAPRRPRQEDNYLFKSMEGFSERPFLKRRNSMAWWLLPLILILEKQRQADF